MQKNTCLSIVLSFTVILSSGCATPLTRSTAGSVSTKSVQSDIHHIIAPGDRLSDIALKYTGNISQWKVIAAHNHILDPRTLRIGDSVIIPAFMIPDHIAVESDAIGLASHSVANANVATGAMAIQRARETETGVRVAPVTTNRSFQLERMDESDIGTTQTRGLVPPKIKVIGTYYPKGIYQQPASYSKLMMRVAPGTIFELDREINDWYKVITNEGVGYLRTIDGKLLTTD